jgi:hypothetical protein
MQNAAKISTKFSGDVRVDKNVARLSPFSTRRIYSGEAKRKTNLGNTAGKKNFPGSTTWRQKADQPSIFVLNLHVHKRVVF